MELLYPLLGINITSTRIISEELAINNLKGVKKAIHKIILISVIISCIASIIFFISSHFIVDKCFHNKAGTSIVYLIAIAFPMISISSAISGYFTAVRKVYKSVIANLLEYIFKIIVTVFLLKNILPTNDIESICFALILGDVLSEVCSFTYNIIMFYFDINKIRIDEYRYKNNYLYRIFRILLPISLTSYIKSGLSTIKQLIIPSSLEKNGASCENALSNYRYNNAEWLCQL